MCLISKCFGDLLKKKLWLSSYISTDFKVDNAEVTGRISPAIYKYKIILSEVA